MKLSSCAAFLFLASVANAEILRDKRGFIRVADASYKSSYAGVESMMDGQEYLIPDKQVSPNSGFEFSTAIPSRVSTNLITLQVKSLLTVSNVWTGEVMFEMDFEYAGQIIDQGANVFSALQKDPYMTVLGSRNYDFIGITVAFKSVKEILDEDQRSRLLDIDNYYTIQTNGILCNGLTDHLVIDSLRFRQDYRFYADDMHDLNQRINVMDSVLRRPKHDFGDTPTIDQYLSYIYQTALSLQMPSSRIGTSPGTASSPPRTFSSDYVRAKKAQFLKSGDLVLSTAHEKLSHTVSPVIKKMVPSHIRGKYAARVSNIPLVEEAGLPRTITFYAVFDVIESLAQVSGAIFPYWKDLVPSSRTLMEQLFTYIAILEAISFTNSDRNLADMMVLTISEMRKALDSSDVSARVRHISNSYGLLTQQSFLRYQVMLLDSNLAIDGDVPDFTKCLAITIQAVDLFPDFIVGQRLKYKCAFATQNTEAMAFAESALIALTTKTYYRDTSTFHSAPTLTAVKNNFDDFKDILHREHVRIWDKGTMSGNCLFEALVDQLRSCGHYGTPGLEMNDGSWLRARAKELRTDIVNEIRNNFGRYALNFDPSYDLNSGSSEISVAGQDYLSTMSREYVYGDSSCIEAFTRLFGLPAKIYFTHNHGRLQDHVIGLSFMNSQTLTQSRYTGGQCSNVNLAWLTHDFGNGHASEHYISVYPE